MVLPFLPTVYGSYFPERNSQSMIDVLNYFKANTPQGASLVLPLNLDHLNREVLEFHLKDEKAKIIGEEFRDEEELLRSGEYFLSIELGPKGPYHKEIRDDSIYRWNAWLRESAMRGKVRPRGSRRFESIGITARIFSN